MPNGIARRPAHSRPSMSFAKRALALLSCDSPAWPANQCREREHGNRCSAHGPSIAAFHGRFAKSGFSRTVHAAQPSSSGTAGASIGRTTERELSQARSQRTRGSTDVRIADAIPANFVLLCVGLGGAVRSASGVRFCGEPGCRWSRSVWVTTVDVPWVAARYRRTSSTVSPRRPVPGLQTAAKLGIRL